jgi:hypothetical protein
MKYYNVEFSFDYFVVSTSVSAEDEEQAEQNAKDRIFEYAGLDVDDLSYEITLEELED